MTNDYEHQAVQFAGLVDEARERLTREEQALREATTLPPVTPRILSSDQHHRNIRLITGEPHESDASTRTLTVAAFVLAMVATGLAVATRRDGNLWMSFTAATAWLAFVMAWMRQHFVRAGVEIDIDDAGFTLGRRVLGRLWSTRYDRRDIAYIHVGISRLALTDEGTVFDLLLYLQPHASTNMARGSVHDKIVLVESRHFDDLNWIGAVLRKQLSVEMPPIDHWVKPVHRRWPASVIRKRAARA
ncbi:MAG: hypothetical protein K8S99_02420 [Planctomycetes bacterium]|nr:hypothetical protein [Planctomycetota bacterium]